MMYWGDGMGGWGVVLMIVSSVLFWGLIVAGIVALVRYSGRGAPQGGSAAETATPEQVLAERYARGEIDEEEYTRRLQVLRTAPQTRRAGG